MMKELIEKYVSNQLTHAELLALRKALVEADEKSLENVFREVWMETSIDDSQADAQRLLHIKQDIDRRLGRKPKRFPVWRKLQVAAAILCPLLMCWIACLYYQDTRIPGSELLVATGNGERSEVILPDGTSVSLNYDSKLWYDPQTYGLADRSIRFSGEAYFNVAKDERSPFLIHSGELDVAVHGTKFNLRVRENVAMAELVLEEGCVQLSLLRTGATALLSRPGQKAVLSYNTGEIRVSEGESVQKAVAWRRGELVFRNEPLRHVVEVMEHVYDVEIDVRCTNRLPELFTGTLPSANLNEALDIIETVFHVKAVSDWQKIIVSD